MSEEELPAATGAPAPWGEEAFTIRERVSARPTLEINGLSSGWAGPGPKTIIPAKAMAKVSCRLVGNQDPHDIYEKLKAYIESLTPPTVRVTRRPADDRRASADRFHPAGDAGSRPRL